jgi:hypothetical protein
VTQNVNDLKIYIGRKGEVVATYSITELIAAIDKGIVQHGDQAWYKGLPDWLPVSEAIPPILPLVPGRGRSQAVRGDEAEESLTEGELPSLAS